LFVACPAVGVVVVAGPRHALPINCIKSLSLSGICVNQITKLWTIKSLHANWKFKRTHSVSLMNAICRPQ